MTGEEFVRRAVFIGYADKKTAKEYAGNRETFYDTDFEDLYRYAERKRYMRDVSENISCDAHAHRVISTGCRTTKSFKVRNSHDDGWNGN